MELIKYSISRKREGNPYRFWVTLLNEVIKVFCCMLCDVCVEQG